MNFGHIITILHGKIKLRLNIAILLKPSNTNNFQNHLSVRMFSDDKINSTVQSFTNELIFRCFYVQL